MRRTLLTPVFLLLLSFTSTAHAGEWGSRGFPRQFVVLGNVVFAADGRGVTTYDVSQPAAITAIDFDTTGAETSGLALVPGSPAHVVVATTRGLDWYRVEGASLTGPVAQTESNVPVTQVATGPRLIAAVAGQTVHVYELQQEAARLVTDYAFRSRVLAVALVGDVLFVSVDREGTYVYPVPSGDWSAKLNEAPVAFARNGDLLWGASPDTGLTGINVRNPLAPQVVASVGPGEYFLNGVAATGTRVFAFEKDNQLRVFDVTDPAKPLLVTTLTEWVNVLAAVNDRLYLTGPVVDAEKLPSASGKPLRVFNATTFSLLGEVSDLAGPLSGVWTDGSLAYVVDPPYLRVMDVSTTEQPRELSSLLVPGIQDHIRVKNGLAVLYGRAAVNLIDVSSPLQPRHIGTWKTLGHPPSIAAIAHDKFLEANPHSGFHVVDYSNPAAPIQVGGRKWHYYDLAAGDDAAYLLLQDSFRVVQIANGKDVVDKMQDSLIAYQLDVVPPNSATPHTLVVRTPVSLRIYSLVEDRFYPKLTATVPLTDPGLMATGDGVVYVTLNGLLHRMDVGAPAQPVATDMKVLSPMQISVAGEKVVVADRYSLRVYGPDTASPVPTPPVKLKRRAVH